MKKIQSIAIAILLTASVLPLLHEVQALDQPFPVTGTITDADGDAIPTGVQVTVTDVDKSTDMTVYTEQNDGSTGFYQADLFNLKNCEDGDTIKVSCTHNGETNAKSFVLDVTDSSKSLSFSLVGAPAVATDPAASVGSSSATLKGSLDDLNDIDTGECQVWFQYGTSTSYGSTTGKQWMDSTGSFSESISGLDPDTKYCYRAVAENSQKKSYGSSQDFTTSATDPTVSTREADSVSYDSAVLNGYLGSPGASTCDVWFVYDTTNHGSWQDYQHSTGKQTTASSTSFSESIEQLVLDTTYHYRAVAENSAGKYDAGDDKTFTTHVVAPSVTTDGVDQQNVTSTSATLSATLTDLGGEQHCDVWFEYGTTASYGYATVNLSLDATGSFNVTVTGLQPGTAYRFRAVARNSQGTAYGTDLSFVTPATQAAIETSSVDYAVVLRANVTDLGGDEHCTAWFEYGPETGNRTNTTPPQTIYEPGTVTEVLTGLQSNVSYRYRAVINNSQGVTYGSNLSFQMLSLPKPPAVEDASAAVTGDNVTFQAHLTALGDSSSCYVWFEYTGEQRRSTAPQRVNGTGSFNATVTGLPRGSYSYRAIAVGDTGRIAYSPPDSVVVGDQDNAPPSITLLSPGNDETVTLDTSLRASVSDPDGDPATVTFHLNGATIAAGTVHNGTTSVAPSLEYGATYTWHVSASDGQNTTISAERTFSTAPSITVNFTHAFPFKGETAWFDDASNGAIASREWTFDHGATADGANVTHTFDTAGSHTVTLTVTDEYGTSFSLERAVTVWRRGDANMDGRINALDITAVELAIEHLKSDSSYSYPPPADVDRSGDLTSQDVTRLIETILGLT